jgi:uncharacterized paraquat-inducible protein A
MTLRKVDWWFVLFAVAVVAGVSLLPTPKDRNPMIPRTPEHQAVRTEKECVACHAADAVRPLPARHPKRPDCFRCHARQAGEQVVRHSSTLDDRRRTPSKMALTLHQ